MLSINGKQWVDLKNKDIMTFLDAFSGEADNDENYFFEFKEAEVNNQKITNEVCAFANTYGGYIFIGVSDSKEVTGCDKWSEERIQNLIYDSITPLPGYEIRKFEIKDKTIMVIKVDEGSRQPYITNRGEIFERVSSGCRKLVDSERLASIYKKNQDLQTRLEKKLEIEPVNMQQSDRPSNIVAILDMGFEVRVSDKQEIQKRFRKYKAGDILNMFKEEGITSVYWLGNTFVISFGAITRGEKDEKMDTMLPAGLNNFLLIYPDGSAKTRCILTADENGIGNLDVILMSRITYGKIYEYLFPDLAKRFVYASKYEQLYVVKSFRPQFSAELKKGLIEKVHCQEGDLSSNNIIYTGGRVPSYGFMQIDKSYLGQMGLEYNAKILYIELFKSEYSFMGLGE